MGIVTDPYTFTNGTTADALQVNARFSAVLAQLNGNLDNTNVAAGANIDGAKLLLASVNGNKLIDASVAKAKLATDALNAFLKLATAADRKAAFGLQSTGGFLGGQKLVQTIAHGMGVTPAFVWMTCAAMDPQSDGNWETPVATPQSMDATNITARVWSPRVSAIGTSIYWLAIA